MRKQQLNNEPDRRLLVPGRAGLLTLEEAEYIKAALVADGRLRRRWGMEDQTRFPLTTIATRAFPENPRAAREHIREQQGITLSPQGRRKEAIQGVLFEAA